MKLSPLVQELSVDRAYEVLLFGVYRNKYPGQRLVISFISVDKEMLLLQAKAYEGRRNQELLSEAQKILSKYKTRQTL